jgi:hypothetical protein
LPPELAGKRELSNWDFGVLCEHGCERAYKCQTRQQPAGKASSWGHLEDKKKVFGMVPELLTDAREKFLDLKFSVNSRMLYLSYRGTHTTLVFILLQKTEPLMTIR